MMALTPLLPENLRPGIADQVLERYRKAAGGPQGLFSYPTGREGLLGLKYPQEALDSLPEPVQDYSCAVGNPFAAGLPEAGQVVLDVGSGAGVDALVAAFYVGPGGRVAGLEFSPDMLARAEANAALSGVPTVSFQLGSAEQLPFVDASFDLLVSNGVYNLVLNKRQALAEAFRVLRPGGRLQVADQIMEEDAAPLLNPPDPGAWAT